jgi:hypothetical protein
MGKIVRTIETEYDVGDVVIFKKYSALHVGIIEGYYVEDSCIWYNIRTSSKFVYTYSNGGDIAEFDIIGIIGTDLKDKCIKYISDDDV